MRKLIVVLIVLLVAGNCFAGGAQDKLASLIGIEPDPVVTARAVSQGPETNLTFWLLGTPTKLDNPDAEISARLGLETDGLEVGAQFDAVGVHGENDETFGIYAVLHIEDDGILGATYFGYAATIIDENRSYGPVAGTILDNIVLEYRYRDFSGESPLGNADDRHQVYAGLYLPF